MDSLPPDAHAFDIPSPPVQPPRPGFPVVSLLAPIAAAGALWAFTRSPYAIVFALLGPVIAIATMIDARRTRRRQMRAERRRYDEELDALASSIAAAHALERAALERAGAPEVIALPHRERWEEETPGEIVVGRGPVRSAVALAGKAQDDRARDVVRAARSLENAPIRVPFDGGIGVVGPALLTAPLLRALVVQISHALGPQRLAIEAGAGSWAEELPHRDGRAIVVGVGLVPRATGVSTVILAEATSVAALPVECSNVIEVDGPARARVTRGSGRGRAFRPDLVGLVEARSWARGEKEAADQLGLVSEHRDPAFADLEHPAPEPFRRSLAVVLGSGSTMVDLVADGPHALVVGTTGSGKSELLVTWITALAATRGVEEVTFLLVDFKGGATFARVARLPHVVGFVTDLEDDAARRAVTSLDAELRHRERVLRSAGVADLVHLDRAVVLPRLVVVIDEFAAMLSAHPELHSTISDIAARGRSLGVHLVLATQRLGGTVRESILANTPLRIVLRTLDRADSQTMIGADAALALPLDRPGSCLIRRGGGIVDPGRIVSVSDADVARIPRDDDATPPRRPWAEPLPAVLGEDDARARLATEGGEAGSGATSRSAWFGLIDAPDEQRVLSLEWAPRTDGHLLVIGGPLSGVTETLATIASRVREDFVLCLELGGDAVQTVDALEAFRPDPAAPAVIVVDDVDLLAAGLDIEYRQRAVERLGYLATLRPADGVALLVGSHSSTGVRGLTERFSCALRLGFPTRAEHLQSGAPADLWQNRVVAGRGEWRGRRIQVIAPTPRQSDRSAAGRRAITGHRALALETPLTVLVSRTPARAAERVRRAFPEVEVQPLSVDTPATATNAPAASASAQASAPTRAARRAAPTVRPLVLVSDIETWNAVRARSGGGSPATTLVIDGSLSDYRSVTRDRALPPPLGPDDVWMIEVGGAVERRTWPTR
ncbi:hypothetical protein MN032_15060 [Agromyces atrinae]|uniref:FtsK/SpoIIIE domain-containing protein n=1 Tax=Agromyces atrinae TaxID=592376 RepID=UPI001F55B7C9|nr:FtsK/SpoIIIE domain-containing protein [Agromyces atrinae]MCI2959014.1 hypothetical protein [Agromyces atrinae]